MCVCVCVVCVVCVCVCVCVWCGVCVLCVYVCVVCLGGLQEDYCGEEGRDKLLHLSDDPGLHEESDYC